MNVFELFATLVLNKKSYEQGLKDAEGEAQGFGGRLRGVLGGAAKVTGAAIAAGFTAASAAAGKIVGQATNAYASYEQLVGGVVTLFGNAADTVQKNAANAFKTVGMSANQYMETVTSFAASLTQSLGGDTAAAAEYADMALRDMADNANKMGTNIASIQNAYQGFAKQNYTMLDNLKLGYGGTKTEMQRLVKNAEQMAKKSGKSFRAMRDENGEVVLSYSDIVEAIHIVQEEMGITGTTALEAGETISGSAASVSAAWQNLLVGMADKNANLEGLVKNLTDAVGTSAKNMLPTIQQALSGLGEVITQLSPVIQEALPTLVHDVVPAVARAGVTLFVALIQNVGEIVSSISQELPGMVNELVNALTDEDNLNKIIDGGITLFGALLGNVDKIIDAMSNGLVRVIDGITTYFDSEENQEKFQETGQKIMMSIIKGMLNIVASISQLFPSTRIMDEALYQTQEDMLRYLGGNGSGGRGTADLEALEQRWNELGQLSAGKYGGGFISEMEEKQIPDMGAAVRRRSQDVADEMVVGLYEGLDQNFPEVQRLFRDDIVEFKLIAEDELDMHSPSRVFKRIGEQIVNGLGAGLEARFPGVIENLRTRVREMVQGVRNELQIQSPSKVFARIGRYMAEGMNEGFAAGMADFDLGSIESMVSRVESSAEQSRDTGKIVQNIYAYQMSPSQAFQAAKEQEQTAKFLGLA